MKSDVADLRFVTPGGQVGHVTVGVSRISEDFKGDAVLQRALFERAAVSSDRLGKENARSFRERIATFGSHSETPRTAEHFVCISAHSSVTRCLIESR